MRRRTFITGMTIGSALTAWGAPTLGMHHWQPVTPRPFRPRAKTLFMSDLHLCADPESAALLDHVPQLARFLRNLRTRRDLSDLVILGDLLDDWMIPAETDPITFDDVLHAPHNAPVVDALHDLCARSHLKVTYVAGNHDMLTFEPANKALIASVFPGITLVADSPGLGAYSIDDVVWAEHGHRYGALTAPDPWSHDGTVLPLGYFITRLMASAVVRGGALRSLPSAFGSGPLRAAPEGFGVLDALDRGPLDKYEELFVRFVLQSFLDDAGRDLDDAFVMNGFHGFASDPTGGEVYEIYKRVLTLWPEHQNIVDKLIAMLSDSDFGGMLPTANILLNMPADIRDLYPFQPRIVIFGHTHQPLLNLRVDGGGRIYANTGTWIDGFPMTWVELAMRDRPGRVRHRCYEVSLHALDAAQPSQRAMLNVPMPTNPGYLQP